MNDWMIAALMMFSSVSAPHLAAASEPVTIPEKNVAVGIVNHSQSLGEPAYLQHHSTILGRDFHLLVRLPEGYSESEQNYPTIYLLDGGATFSMLAGYYYYLKLEELVPDAIIVGISYGSADFESGNMRSTDYTAPSDQRSYWGGAKIFQRVLETEILPKIETQFRSAAQKSVLFGQSIAGQFVLFSALQRPGVFTGYIASNPALHRNYDFFTHSLKTKSNQTIIARSQLYVASGALDDPRFRDPALAWIKHWEAQVMAPFQLKAETIEGYGHFSIAPEAFRRGVIWALEDSNENSQ